jgi:uroporphyrinogen-III synthase
MSHLNGRHIVVTRPIAQTAHLLQALFERGAIPVKFPVLAIHELQDSSAIVDAAIRLEGFDLVIFVSPNAVVNALNVILKQRHWPADLRVATMGRSSEQALAARGITNVIAPSVRFDSEALLELPELQSIQGQKILVCRGDSGRELLGKTLNERGAMVEFLTCYHRSRPTLDAAPLLSLWQEGKLDAVTLTSSEGLRNFCVMIGRLGMAWLKHTPTFLTHTRIAEFARDEGLENIILTEPGDDGLLAGLEAYFVSHGTQH